MKFRVSSLLGQVVLPILTTIYFVSALRLAPPWEDERVTVSFFPIVLSILMYAGLAFLAWQNASASKPEGQSVLKSFDPLKIAILTTLYILFFKSAGYAVSTVFYVLGLLFVFKYAQNNLLKAIGFSILVTAIFYAFFGLGFNIRLPKLLGVI